MKNLKLNVMKRLGTLNRRQSRRNKQSQMEMDSFSNDEELSLKRPNSLWMKAYKVKLFSTLSPKATDISKKLKTMKD